MPILKSTLCLIALAAISGLSPRTAAAQAPAQTPAQAEAPKPPKRERNVISRDELVEAADKFADLYQAIRMLRPHFLTANNRGLRTSGVGGASSSSNSGRQSGTGGSANADALPVLYLDERKSGDILYLKGIPTKAVAEVRYMTPNEAGMEYGLGHEGGAIVVKLFRGKP